MKYIAPFTYFSDSSADASASVTYTFENSSEQSSSTFALISLSLLSSEVALILAKYIIRGIPFSSKHAR